MFKIDDATAVGVIPTPGAAGTPGYFTEGDPGGSVPATIVTADWLNAVQEEIAYAITANGGTLSKTNRTQLKAAIDTAISTAITGAYPMPQGHLYALTLSNGTDAVHDIDIAVGGAKSADNTFDITVATAIGKQIDAAWAAGGTPGAPTGGFPTGITLTNSTWYRVFLIAKPDGTVGAGFDTSATAANLLADATGYTKYRQIGWIRYGTATIIKFGQDGDEFIYDVPASDYSAATVDAGTLITLSVPPNKRAKIRANFTYTNAAGAVVWFQETRQTSAAPTADHGDLFSNNADQSRANIYRLADSSSQIRMRSLSGAGNGGTVNVDTIGWVDNRGRF